MKHIPVENSSHLVRDRSTGAIINMDKNGLEAAKARKAARKKELDEIQDLKEEVKQIKSLLLKISENINYK